MRSGKYGSYEGKEYKLGSEKGETINLVSKDMKNLDNGFVRYDRFPWIFIKSVNKESLDYIVNITSYVIIDDDKFEIIGARDNDVVIVTDDESIASKHNMERTDIHEYRKSISLKGLNVIEEKVLID
jgi:hypothetical protein